VTEKPPRVIEGDNIIGLFDILGFRARISATPPEDFRKLLDEVLHLSKAGLVHESMVGGMLFSDTVVLYGKGRSLESSIFGVVVSASNLLNIAARRGLAIRGAITRGPLLVDEKVACVVGTPLVRAYDLEKSQQWMGAIVDPTHANLIHSHMNESLPECLINYPAPLKSGPRVPYVCVGWTFRLHERRDSIEHAFQGADEDHSAYTKLQNTLAFYDHCKALGHERVHP
jgi:hypothetical protein